MEPPQRIDLAWHGWADLAPPQLYELLQFRQAIFVVEQASPYPDLAVPAVEVRIGTAKRGTSRCAGTAC